jgi:hypothetical protein
VNADPMRVPKLSRDSIQSVLAAANQNRMKTIRGQQPGELEADSAGRPTRWI